MKTKTIAKIITKKMNEWLETIADKTLRGDVKKNILISGGSIASMLLKEQVNDYDVYIQNMDVLKRLAEYYKPGDVLDGRLRGEYLEKRFPKIPESGFWDNPESGKNERYSSEAYVRISNLKPNQIKIDVSGAGVRIERKEDEKYLPVFISQNAISLTEDVQIVLRFNGNVEQIHKTFDYIHATNYFTFQDGLILNQAALESLITKNLVYQGSLYPLTSVIRMKKFIRRGWTMSAGEILKILFQVSELDLTDIEVLEDQLIGVDVAYFSMLIDALRNVDKKKITSRYINSLIDKVFSQYDGDSDNIKSESSTQLKDLFA